MLNLGRRVLVLGAHTDDEFACSGTIVRLIEEGADVSCAIFSSCEESVPAGFDRDVLKQEARDAMAVLGIPSERFSLFDFPVRRFPEHRQAILEELIQLRARLAPELVLLPALSDLHQDHAVVAREGLRAFKHATVLGYEMPMNSVTFQHACFIQLEPRHLKRKLAHMRCYRSQQGRPYFRPEFIRSLATVRGLQMNVDAAEAFEVVRLCVTLGANHVD
jgi:LmbE family N-acetylglucosaminyl deacetylase